MSSDIGVGFLSNTELEDMILLQSFCANNIEYQTDRVYKMCRGIFGCYPKVVLKTASKRQTIFSGKTHASLAKNDVDCTQFLSHCENIARIFYYVNRADFVVLVAEGYDVTLAQHINKFGGFTTEEPKTTIGISDVGTIFRQVFKGVDYIHEKGLVHCDINCSNIFIQTGLLDKINL